MSLNLMNILLHTEHSQGFFARVDEQMICEGTPLTERLLTQITLVRLFTRMDDHMLCENVSLSECLVAHFTHMRLLARVDERMLV